MQYALTTGKKLKKKWLKSQKHILAKVFAPIRHFSKKDLPFAIALRRVQNAIVNGMITKCDDYNNTDPKWFLILVGVGQLWHFHLLGVQWKAQRARSSSLIREECDDGQVERY